VRIARASIVVALALAVATLIGCEIGAPEPVCVGGYSAVFATPPADVYLYPRASFAGRNAFWVHDRWFYDGPQGWVIFRQEPPPLQRFRSFVQQAPPAPRSPAAPARRVR
jgi:hypothetical protein